jgi:hypothetical protein
VPTTPARLVVLVSGAGTNLQALLDACADPAYGARVVAVGADRDGIEGLARAERAGVPTFVLGEELLRLVLHQVHGYDRPLPGLYGLRARSARGGSRLTLAP